MKAVNADSMSESYSKAPITEAIIDFRITPLETFDSEAFNLLAEGLKKNFPTQEETQTGTAEFNFDGQGIPVPEVIERSKGFRLTSDDAKRVLAVATDGYSFSNLHPYDTWETFFTEAKDLWHEYKRICSPRKITRVAVRYINRFDLPVHNNVSAYVQLYPFVPQEMPQRNLNGFFMQLQVPQRDIDSMLIVNEARVESPNPETLSLILDFDLFRYHEWDIDDDESAWSFLDTLRVRKNQVFEACITQKMRDLIK